MKHYIITMSLDVVTMPTHRGKLFLGEEVVGVARLATTCTASSLDDAGFTGPLRGQVSDLGGGGERERERERERE